MINFFHLVQTALAQHMDQELVVKQKEEKTVFLIKLEMSLAT